MLDLQSLLRDVVHRTPAPLVMALATLAADGSPRARNLICRRLDDEFTLWFVTDARSAKCEQLRANPAAEAVWWLPEIRQQFRFRGNVQIIDEANPSTEREVFWKVLSDELRGMFFWPSPGAPRVADVAAFPRRAAAEHSPPPPFELLALRPYEIEQLDLNQTPHDRRVWRSAHAWACERLNP